MHRVSKVKSFDRAHIRTRTHTMKAFQFKKTTFHLMLFPAFLDWLKHNSKIIAFVLNRCCLTHISVIWHLLPFRGLHLQHRRADADARRVKHTKIIRTLKPYGFLLLGQIWAGLVRGNVAAQYRRLVS